MGGPWRFWIDVGGTFTDCIAVDPHGEVRQCKVLSSGAVKARTAPGSVPSRVVAAELAGRRPDFFVGYRCRVAAGAGDAAAPTVVASTPAGEIDLSAPLPLQAGDSVELRSGEPAPLVGIRWLLDLGLESPIEPAEVRLGTTRGTNALLERSGAATALLTNAGLEDLLEIGYQDRPELFRLAIVKADLLQCRSAGLGARLGADGGRLRELEAGELDRVLLDLRRQGVSSLAVCLLHAYKDGEDERRIGRRAAELGFDTVSLSHEVAPAIGMIARAGTTVLDAYLTPVIRRYVETIAACLPGSDLRLMTSAGGLVTAAGFRGRDCLLSGPAGGFVAVGEIARGSGVGPLIGFDMGGTSTDVCRYSGELEIEHETTKSGVRILAPVLAIETVAAGGGSICRFDGERLLVGPESTGADPGPACYGAGGPLAVTDMNLILGRLPEERFPFELDRAACEGRLRDLQEDMAAAGAQLDLFEIAAGFVTIANQKMAAAIERISVEKGHDAEDFAMVCFGGAAGQHACAVAARLGMRQIIVHPLAGVLSAFGLGVADIRKHAVRTVLAELDGASIAEVGAVFAELGEELRPQLLAEGAAAEEILPPRQSLELRYAGQSSTLEVVAAGDSHEWRRAFEHQHEELYGHRFADRAVEIVAARVELVARMARPELPTTPAAPRRPDPSGRRQVWFEGGLRDCAIFDRELLRPGDEIEGPALIEEDNGATLLEPGWEARVASGAELMLERRAAVEQSDLEVAAAVRLEVFHQHFAAIAEQMGTALRRTSLSVNVKERLDFSCAVFTGRGELVANAPHMPVHLGAMSETIRCVLEDVVPIGPGDVIVTNDPFRGGSHLPDVTVITPVCDEASGEVLFFTASRAHHAEIGGIRPGSMPPDSRNLEEEGVLIAAMKVVDAGRPRFEALEALLRGARYPSRSVSENLADISAQLAANQAGARRLQELVARHGAATVQGFMRRIQEAAERRMRACLAALPDGRHRFRDCLDDGSAIVVAVEIDGDRARVDFAGTAPPLATNLNANLAIVRAAVIYVFRCLLRQDVPLNEGVLAAIDIRVPPSLLRPPRGPTPAETVAVVGGNVETSQRVTDVLLGALRAAAASQGTMNNLTFGGADFGYYETICGGAGAGPGFAGASAVHTHMTNTRLTDPEVLESRYPVRLLRFARRRGSGGAGRWRGGDGVVRELELLAPLEVSILSQRRTTRPFGLAGGADAAAGRNTWLPVEGEPEDLGPVASRMGRPGDRIRIETPGGGGFGSSDGDGDG